MMKTNLASRAQLNHESRGVNAERAWARVTADGRPLSEDEGEEIGSRPIVTNPAIAAPVRGDAGPQRYRVVPLVVPLIRLSTGCGCRTAPTRASHARDQGSDAVR
jgi:hypothetical protein